MLVTKISAVVMGFIVGFVLVSNLIARTQPLEGKDLLLQDVESGLVVRATWEKTIVTATYKDRTTQDFEVCDFKDKAAEPIIQTMQAHNIQIEFLNPLR